MNHRRHMGALLAAAPVALVLAGCGSDEATLPEGMEEEFGELLEDVDAEETSTDNQGPEIVPLEILLPEEGTTPSGWTRLPATCASPEGVGWFTHAVPAGWEKGGVGSGSGGPLGHSVDVTYRTGSGEVTVALDGDSRDHDGEFTDGSDGSFDYEWESFGDDGTASGEITFDRMSTVQVGDQEVEIFVADPSQAPDIVSSVEHKARVEVAQVPNPAPGDRDGQRPHSYVIEIRYSPEDVQLPDATVEGIVASLAMPECSREMLVVTTEVQLSADVDEDGNVATAEDFQELLGQ